MNTNEQQVAVHNLYTSIDKLVHSIPIRGVNHPITKQYFSDAKDAFELVEKMFT